MEIHKLARELAPILHFHPEEGQHCCFPSDAEQVFERFQGNWELFEADKTPRSLDSSVPCYYEYWKDDGLIQIRYWFWYNYNDFPRAPLGLGKHLGDWEHVEVRLFPIDQKLWLLSNHDGARAITEKCTFSKLITEQGVLKDKHINAWVALGSHAHYPSPSSKPRCYGQIFCDKIADDGPILFTENTLKLMTETNFKNYRGRWGDEKAPWSPFNERNNRWRNSPDIRPI